MTDPWGRPNEPTQAQPHQPGPPPPPPSPAQSHQPGPPAAPSGQSWPQQPETPAYGGPPAGPPQGPPPQAPTPEPARKGNKFTRLFRDPLSIVLVVVIVLALIAAGVVGGELYARNRANDVVAAATKCVVQDDATVSFGGTPFLWQHLTGHYDGIHITTAGNNIRDIQGMKADILIDDVRLQDSGDSKGTIGKLDATITWATAGMLTTIKDSIGVLGVGISGVKTNPSDGTIELEALLGNIIVKPTVGSNGGISLEIQQLTGLGFILPRETIQPALDAVSTKLTENYPLGIKADSVEVTDTGVTAKFSTQNASLPAGESDPCFAGL